MDKKFIESMKNDLLARRQTILASLAEQSDDMKKLIKTLSILLFGNFISAKGI